jgi:peptidoglycan hydrolase CwlO-like protein
VEGLREEIQRLRSVVIDAKAKQKEAEGECKRLEKEMQDFKNNKDSKLKEDQGKKALSWPKEFALTFVVYPGRHRQPEEGAQ